MSSEAILHELDPVFHPRSIAFAGASQHTDKIGTLMLRNFLAAGFKGDVYPINPGGGSIDGLTIYSSVRDVPGPVDYVIVAVPSAHVLDLIDDCAAKRVKVVQFFSAGFSETGRAENIAVERLMKEKAKSAGMRIIGPNCVGISCPAYGIPVPTSGGIGHPGTISFLSQSGGHTETLADIGVAREIRFSKMISFGNGSDLNEIDFLKYLAVDPETEILGTYVENGKNGRLIFDLIKEIARSKPVVVWKGGETEAGGEIAASHTGSLAGSNIIWESAINQAGAVKVSSLNELADTFLAFQNISRLKGNRAGIISQLGGGAGGVAVSAADICTWHGLDVPSLAGKTHDRLSAVIRSAGTILRNPLDLGLAGRFPDVLKEVLSILDDDPSLDLIMVTERMDFLLLFYSLDEINTMNDVLTDFRAKGKKPLIVVSTPASSDLERIAAEKKLLEDRIPVYSSFDRAAKAVANLIKYWRNNELKD